MVHDKLWKIAVIKTKNKLWLIFIWGVGVQLTPHLPQGWAKMSIVASLWQETNMFEFQTLRAYRDNIW